MGGGKLSLFFILERARDCDNRLINELYRKDKVSTHAMRNYIGGLNKGVFIIKPCMPSHHRISPSFLDYHTRNQISMEHPFSPILPR